MDDFLVNLGLKIRGLRREKGFTQDKVAELAGITGKYMGMIERGEVNVSIKVLENLGGVFGVRMTDFFSFEQQVPPEDLRNELHKAVDEASDPELRLLSMFASSLRKI